MSIPSITTLPARIDADLGRPKIEEPSADRERDLSGAELNRIQYWIETLGAVLGKTDGSTAGSVLARIATLELGVADPDSTVVSRYDDLDDTSPWTSVSSGTGSLGISGSLSPGALSSHFPSRGVFSLQIGAGAGIARLYRPLAGMMHSATQPIVLTWRSTKVIDNSLVTDPTTSPCAALWGMAGGFSLGVPNYGVFLAATIDGGGHRLWRLAIYSGGLPTYTALTTPMPACTWFELRITADAAHVKLEVSPEGGAWQTILNSSSVSAPDGVYVPYAEADYSTGVGNAKVFLDAVGWTASRETAHAGSTVTGVDFPLTGYAVGTSSDIAPLGRAASAGGTGKLADAGHVHDAGIIAIQSKSASFTLATTDSNVHIDTTGGVVQITLYAPGGVPREHFLKHIAGANKITVLHGSVNVEGAAADLDLPGSGVAPTSSTPQAWRLYSDGTNWWIA